MADMRSNLSEEEKARRRKARLQTKVMRDYLEGLQVTAPQRGKGRRKSAQERYDEAQAALVDEPDTLRRVILRQQSLDAEEELALESSIDMNAREAAFVEHLKDYSRRKGISYKAWRHEGVPANVLRKGGMRRART